MTFCGKTTEAIGVLMRSIRKLLASGFDVATAETQLPERRGLKCSGFLSATAGSEMPGRPCVGGMCAGQCQSKVIQSVCVALGTQRHFTEVKKEKRASRKREQTYSENICGFLLSNVSLM